MIFTNVRLKYRRPDPDPHHTKIWGGSKNRNSGTNGMRTNTDSDPKKTVQRATFFQWTIKVALFIMYPLLVVGIS